MTRQPGETELEVAGEGLRLRQSAVIALRLLETCPLVPVDAFVHLAGLTSASGAYKQLANLRRAGLAEVQRVDLGYLLGERPLGLWKITKRGGLALQATRVDGPCDHVGEGRRSPDVARSHAWRGTRGTNLTLLVAAYRLLALLVAERAADGANVDVGRWEQPWVRHVWSPQRLKLVRVELPAGAELIPRDAVSKRVIRKLPFVLLIPDLGTAPVARYREMLRRLIALGDSSAGRELEVVVATLDRDGEGARGAAWLQLLDTVIRREGQPAMLSRVVSWERVAEVVGRSRLAGVAGNGPRQRQDVRRALQASHAPVRGREQLLHLVGRHPFLTVRQLAHLLGTTTARIKRLEQELIKWGWLRQIELNELADSGIGTGRDECGLLGLVEITLAGRRQLAGWLGLEPLTATRYHGLIGNARGQAGRRRRLLRTLAHTVGANSVFVAFAVAAESATRQGGTDQLVEWRGAAACERRHCKPDGYGCYVRSGVEYGFFLEYDRGTERAWKYATKLRAYYWYRDSGQASRDYNGFPTLLFVTTHPTAEERIAQQAHRAWFVRGTDPLPVLVTTTWEIGQHREGILGPIWRAPTAAHGLKPERVYWLRGRPPRALSGYSGLSVR